MTMHYKKASGGYVCGKGKKGTDQPDLVTCSRCRQIRHLDAAEVLQSTPLNGKTEKVRAIAEAMRVGVLTMDEAAAKLSAVLDS